MFIVGGPSRIVEMDETSVKKKATYGKGKQHSDCWLFGGVGRYTKNGFGVLTYQTRKKAFVVSSEPTRFVPGASVHEENRHNCTDTPAT